MGSHELEQRRGSEVAVGPEGLEDWTYQVTGSPLVQGGCHGPRGVSDFVPSLQANKLACYCFMVANRSETSEFSTAKAMSRLWA